MTPNEKRVKQLAYKLPDRRRFLLEELDAGRKLVDESYDAGQGYMFVIGESCEEYQVIRHFGVDIGQLDPLEHLTDDEEDEYLRINQEYDRRTEELERAYHSLDGGFITTDTVFAKDLKTMTMSADSEYQRRKREIDRWFNDKMEEFDEAVYERAVEEDGFYEYSCDEAMQEWINLSTNEIVILGRIFEEKPIYFDSEKKLWSIMRRSMTQHRHFLNSFLCNFGHGHYIDLSVNPILENVGYTGIDASDWYYGCGEDDAPESSQFVQRVAEDCGSYGQFLVGMVDGVGNAYDTIFKAYGSYACFHVVGKDDDYKNAYLAATKIIRRNHYVPSDMQLWDDMVDALIWLGKDCHNRVYVCPDDLRAAHDRWIALKARKENEIKIKKLKAEAKMHEKNYAERVGKYLDIVLHGKDYDIFVCPTVADMAEEGEHMHHCVYRMGYYKAERNSLILFVRSKSGERISTLELNTRTWNIVQNRGVNNSVPANDNSVRNLVKRHINEFRNAGQPKIVPIRKKRKSTIKTAA